MKAGLIDIYFYDFVSVRQKQCKYWTVWLDPHNAIR